MVLSSAADSQQPNASPSQLSMAAPPASDNSGSRGATTPFKPLHNFPLEDLGWSMSHSRNNRGADPPAPEERKKPSKFFVRLRGKRVGNPANDGAPAAPSQDVDVAVAPPPPSSPPPPCPAGGDGDDVEVDDDDDVAAEHKTWNLRPRKAVTNPRGPTGGGGGGETKKKDREKEKDEKKDRAMEKEKREREKEVKRERERVRRKRLKEEKNKNNSNSNTNNEKESKQERGISLAIPLTKDEIEQDFLAFAGSSPSRRPKKRPRHIQKQLDCVFPGLWLNPITPESYKVDEHQTKPRK